MENHIAKKAQNQMDTVVREGFAWLIAYMMVPGKMPQVDLKILY